MRRVAPLGALLLTLACAACGTPNDGSDGVPVHLRAHPGTAAASSPESAASPVAAAPPSPPADATVVPQHLRIPSVGIDVDVVPVGETPSGDLAVPAAWQQAGWFSLGYRPGERGHAVVVGHLDTDSRAHPYAAFTTLHSVSTGADVVVSGNGGTPLHFVVTAMHTYPADAVPLQQVFGADTVPTLELLTCAGTWRGTALGYSERLVVTAQETLS